jgi:hypothetical protein
VAGLGGYWTSLRLGPYSGAHPLGARFEVPFFRR